MTNPTNSSFVDPNHDLEKFLKEVDALADKYGIGGYAMGVYKDREGGEEGSMDSKTWMYGKDPTDHLISYALLHGRFLALQEHMPSVKEPIRIVSEKIKQRALKTYAELEGSKKTTASKVADLLSKLTSTSKKDLH